MQKQNLVILIASIAAAIIIALAVYMQVHLITEHAAFADEEKQKELLKLAIHVVTFLPALIGMLLVNKDVGRMITIGYLVYVAIIGFCYYFLLHGSDALEAGILLIVLAIPYSIALSIFGLIRVFQRG